MSSVGLTWDGVVDGEITLERVIDHVGETPFEAANRLTRGVAGGATPIEVRTGGWVVVGLRHRDAMKRSVELAIAHTTEPVTNVVGRPDGERCRAVVPRVRVLGTEAIDTSCLAEDLRRREDATALDGKEKERQSGDQIACQARHEPGNSRETRLHGGDVLAEDQPPCRWLPRGVDLVKVPAQPIDDPGPFPDEVVAMAQQEPDLPLGTVEPRLRQVGLAKCSSSHGQGIDRVRLTERPSSITTVRHQLGRYAHDPLAGAEQITLQSARKDAAVLNCPESRRVEALSPCKQTEVVRRGWSDRVLAELPAELVDGDDSVTALVCVDSKGHHTPVSLCVRADRTDRWALPQ